MKKFLFYLALIGLVVELIMFGGKLPNMGFVTWLWIIGGCALLALIIFVWRVIARAVNGRRTYNRSAASRPVPSPQPRKDPVMAPVSEKKPIPPKKVAIVAALAFLVMFSCGGTWAVKNIVTVLLIAVPVGVFLGMRVYLHAKDAALYTALAIGVMELFAYVVGGLDGIYKRVAVMGGELQCLSTIALIIVGVVLLNKQTHFINRILGDSGVDVQATIDEFGQAAGQVKKGVLDWLHEDKK